MVLAVKMRKRHQDRVGDNITIQLLGPCKREADLKDTVYRIFFLFHLEFSMYLNAAWRLSEDS